MNPARDEDDGDQNERSAKAKRFDFELPMADVDIKLAEKLDNILKISSNTRPKFLTNKTKPRTQESACNTTNIVRENINPSKLKPRNLTKEELNERVLKKYDTLVPKEDPRRPKMAVKFLSTTESIELGRVEAKRQLERQLELNSISGNQAAIKNGLKGFRFRDGYEKPTEHFSHHSNHLAQPKSPGCSILKLAKHDTPNCSRSVTFAAENVDKTDGEEDDEADNSADDDDLSDSDCSTVED